jgi:hypothetical protein
MWSSSISPKAGKNLKMKLAVLRGTRSQKAKMATFEHKGKDEGDLRSGGAIDHEREINMSQFQGGSAANGRHVSKGGGIGKAESQVGRKHIDQQNKKVWPRGGDVKSGNPKTGNTRMKGPIARSGGPYGGGGRDTQ